MGPTDNHAAQDAGGGVFMGPEKKIQTDPPLPPDPYPARNAIVPSHKFLTFAIIGLQLSPICLRLGFDDLHKELEK